MAYLLALVLLAGLHLRPDIPASKLVERYGQPPSEFVTVDDMQVHVRDGGDGPTLVLLGIFSSLLAWEPWVSQLEDSFRLVRLDLPGFGLTGPRPDRDYRIENDVALLDAVADSLGLERFIVAGCSFGGLVAWKYAQAHPERTNGLVLVNTVGYLPEEKPPVYKLIRIPLLGRLPRIISPRYLLARILRGAYVDDSLVTPERIDLYYHMILRKGNRQAILDRIHAPLPVGNDPITGVVAPTLILWGEEDHWLSVEHARRIAGDLPKSRLIIYPGIGHVPCEEKPEITAREVRDFFSGMQGRMELPDSD